MHRATVVYILMIFACAVGLWGVLVYGNRLQAPEDLAGKWTLSPISQTAAHPQSASYGPAMTIDQSGQFFQVSFENGPRLDLRLQENQLLPMQDKPVVFMKLAESRGWSVRAWGPPGGDVWRVFVNRPTDSEPTRQEEWIANRVTRTFPAHVSGKGAH